MVEKRALPEFFNGLKGEIGVGGGWVVGERRRRRKELDNSEGLLSVGFARSAIVDYPGESPVTRTSRWEGWRGRRKESRQRESRWEVGESPGNVSRGGR
uniref:Uncharacterized protein n=1 Tax=Timema bartmani TaxID=61472 RepID=A0A7R9FBH3_9NEOP|nr:unnamed protein product [Timema bartmani]